MIPSDLALAIWSLLINGQIASCCFIARLYTQSAAWQVHVRLDSLTYFQLLFPVPSIASLKFDQIQAENLLKHQQSPHSTLPLTPNVDTQFYCENVRLITDSLGI